MENQITVSKPIFVPNYVYQNRLCLSAAVLLGSSSIFDYILYVKRFCNTIDAFECATIVVIAMNLFLSKRACTYKNVEIKLNVLPSEQQKIGIKILAICLYIKFTLFAFMHTNNIIIIHMFFQKG